MTYPKIKVIVMLIAEIEDQHVLARAIPGALMW